MITFNRVPRRPVLISWRIARWFASIPLNNKRIEINHSEMIPVHVQDTLPGDARRQGRDGGECGRLRHLVYLMASSPNDQVFFNPQRQCFE